MGAAFSGYLKQRVVSKALSSIVIRGTKESIQFNTCANETIMFVAVSVITVTKLARNIPLFCRTNTLPTMART